VRHFRKLLLIGFFLLITTSYVAAQTGCSDIVERALLASDVLCRDIQNNEACYGHTSIQATARPNVTNFTFTAPGHVANIATIQEMRLAELNEQRVEWGIAHLRLQGNIPGTIPGQFVTVLAFGSERRGLSEAMLGRADRRIAIPMRAGVSSLNLAAAVAVVLYAWRLAQRG